MTKNIDTLLSAHKGETFLAIFAHADDASFVAGGLFQLLEKFGIETKIICLTYENEEELQVSSGVLGVDKTLTFKYKSGELLESRELWVKDVKDEITKTKPFCILTFDPHGITGNSEHTISCIEVFNMVNSMKENKPILLWRVSDSEEKKYFAIENEKHKSIMPSHHYFLKIGESFKKLKAIYSHKSKFKSLLFKLRILEWYLFDHKELYFLVDFHNNKYKLVFD